MIWKNQIQDGDYSFWQPSYPFFWLNLITIFGVGSLLIFAPCFILFYYCLSFKKWESDQFESRMGALLEGMRKTTVWALFYPLFFIVRRIILSLQAVYLLESFSAQTFTFILMSLIHLTYLLHFRPFAESLQQNLEVMNEGSGLVLTYFVLGLNSDWIPEGGIRATIGLYFVLTLFLNIAVNFFFLFRTIAHGY